MPVLIATVLTSTPTVAGASATQATSVSADTPVSIVGGSPDRRQTVVDAVERFLAAGLALPELEVHLHADNTGCAGKQGLFHPSGDIAVIDLCYPGEFLALHELGHSWEHFNLDDQARSEFQKLTGATTWRSPDVVWRRRGAEQAANALAHGLLSAPLASIDYRSLEFERFETLTGIPTPRIAEIETSDDPVAVPSSEQLNRAAAYAEWRRASAAAAISSRLGVAEPVAPCSSLDSYRLDCVRKDSMSRAKDSTPRQAITANPTYRERNLELVPLATRTRHGTSSTVARQFGVHQLATIQRLVL